MSGLDLATRCIQEVVPEAGAGARVVMEAGYVLLGAMCVALPQDVMDVSHKAAIALLHRFLAMYVAVACEAVPGELLLRQSWCICQLMPLICVRCDADASCSTSVAAATTLCAVACIDHAL